MTSTDSNEPTPDEFDELLAESIATNRTEENVRDNARLVATYHSTLVEEGVPEDCATEITCSWVVAMMETEG